MAGGRRTRTGRPFCESGGALVAAAHPVGARPQTADERGYRGNRRRTDDLYLDEVRRCDLYVGLFGNEYGSENAEGISPTEREFDLVTAEGKYRLIFVKGTDDEARHPKMRSLVGRTDPKAVQHPVGTGHRAVCGAGRVPCGEAVDPLRPLRRGPMRKSDARRSGSGAYGVVYCERQQSFRCFLKTEL
jgi:hypothetical protein